VGHDTSSDRTSDGTVKNDTEQAETSLGQDAEDNSQFRIGRIEHPESLNQEPSEADTDDSNTKERDHEIQPEHLTFMTDESEMVAIWLGTQDLPPIQVYASKVLNPLGMLSLLKLTLGVEMNRCWFEGNVLRLKGGEEFIVNTKTGNLHSGYLVTHDRIHDEDECRDGIEEPGHDYLNTWEVADVLDPPDEQAELAVLSEVIEHEETERYAINDSDGYRCQRTLSIKPTQSADEIWQIAEKRLGTDRSNFALVSNGRYVPLSGEIDQPRQFFKIRYRGRAGEGLFQEEKRCLRDPIFGKYFIVLHWSIPESIILGPMTVGDLRDKGMLKRWGGYDSLDIGRQVGDRWISLNHDHVICSGVVTIRARLQRDELEPVIVSLPIVEEEEEDDTDQEKEDDTDQEEEEDSDDEDDSEEEEDEEEEDVETDIERRFTQSRIHR
jgi:hypothetical protein